MVGVDRSSFASELEAVCVLLRAFASIPRSKTSLHLLLDSRCVLQTLRHCADPRLRWRLGQWLRDRVTASGVRAHWVPAHGRHPEWRDPTLPCSADFARELNQAAPAACDRELLRQRSVDFPRVAWLSERARAREWARVVLCTASRTQACCRLLWTPAPLLGG